MNRNLKNFSNSWGGVQGGKKSGLCKKKSKRAHYFFMTKATDLKTIFLKALEKCKHRIRPPSLYKVKITVFLYLWLLVNV